MALVCVYSDGSGYDGGIGTSAVLYVKDQLIKSLRYYLGTEFEHMVYEAEGVGLVMGLHLLKNLNLRLTHPTILGADSQVAIRVLDNQRSHPSQYILDSIHDAAESLHKKQDRLINRAERNAAIVEGNRWEGRSKGVVNLQVHWVLGHMDFAPNEKADEEAKKATQGDSSDAKSLPALLHKHLPLSLTVIR